MSLAAILALMEGGRTYSGQAEQNIEARKELERRGVDIPWYQGLWKAPLGMAGMELETRSLQRKLDRTAPSPYGRTPRNADVTAAAVDQIRAEQDVINRQLAMGIQRTGLRYGQAGTYQSGARKQAEDLLERGAMTDLSNALARVGLQTAGLQEQGRQFDINAAMAESQLRAQKRAADTQALAAGIEAGIPLLFDQLLSKYSGGEAAPSLETGGGDFLSNVNAMNPGMDWQQGDPYNNPIMNDWLRNQEWMYNLKGLEGI
jgi:hypothetical protein